MANTKIYYSVKPKGTILIWKFVRKWEAGIFATNGKILQNQYKSEVIIYDKPHPLPKGFFEDVSKFISHLQDNFEKYGKISRIALRNKIQELEKR
jgi:hypothetical protein